jgi:hypothetical protein
MSSEVFRFVTIRPPQESGDGSTSTAVIDLGLPKNAFFESLRELRVSGTRDSMLGAVRKFETTSHFITSARAFDQKLLEFAAAVGGLPSEGFWAGAGEAFTRIFDTSPGDFVTSTAFTTPFGDVASSIVGALIDGSVLPRARGLLVRMLRALWLIRRLAEGAAITRSAFVNVAIALPAGIFPLPTSDVSAKGQAAAAENANEAAVAARRKRVAQLSAELEVHRKARLELLNAFEQSGAQPAPPAATTEATAAPAVRSPAGFLLTDTAVKALSGATKAVLKTIGVTGPQVDVAKSVTLVERQSAEIATQLYGAIGTSGTMVQLGSSIIPQNALTTGWTVFPGPGDPADPRMPGPCPPAPSGTPPDDGVTVPTGHGDARILGIADLLLVEQELLRYQLGEIAHIENVLRSEVRSRRFRTTDTMQQTVTATTEVTEEKEQDLSSTQRFELQTESQTVISQSASKDAGLTIHASYGPSVDATANFNMASSTSTQQAHTASSSYATEVTNKAVDRVQTRTLTSRTVTTTHEIEEVNRHAFDNQDGAEDIVGVYRYVDKVYSAQIVNYGKRLMLEFIVPEPAAFLRYALTNKPVNNVTAVNPEPPGYCLADGTTFVKLQAADITPDKYLYWASKYGAQDVTPPPPSVIIASGSLKSPDQMQSVGDRLLCSDLFDVTITDGYLTHSAFINIYGETQAGDHRVVVQLQEQQSVYVEPWDDLNAYVLHLQPTPTLTVTVNSIGFHNYEILATVFCTLSTEKYQDWQLKTFDSIMNAYNDLKSAYDTAVEEARLQASDGAVGGTNPETNRVTEQTELKKACISLLTGQRFELFDAVQRNIAPYGYPEIDFAEAKADGAYIQMFEQSFEWNNMIYLFYPYFWGKKGDWVTIAQLSDNDPLFAQFLQAGAARVQVPVRLGFEQNVLTYLSTGEIWAGDGAIINTDGGDDTLHLSIIDELKSQTGNNNVEGMGTLSVTHHSAEVSGTGTEFTSDDESRRIIVGKATYVIASVHDASSITLTTPFAGDSAHGLGYALGGKLVEQPWEVKLPTALIKLDSSMVIT